MGRSHLAPKVVDDELRTFTPQERFRVAKIVEGLRLHETAVRILERAPIAFGKKRDDVLYLG
jgi:hypothetical protein